MICFAPCMFAPTRSEAQRIHATICAEEMCRVDRMCVEIFEKARRLYDREAFGMLLADFWASVSRWAALMAVEPAHPDDERPEDE
jgi:hypothetical protein